jgi:predicted GIY-YIG superfamily endonuclease
LWQRLPQKTSSQIGRSATGQGSKKTFKKMKKKLVSPYPLQLNEESDATSAPEKAFKKTLKKVKKKLVSVPKV